MKLPLLLLLSLCPAVVASAQQGVLINGEEFGRLRSVGDWEMGVVWSHASPVEQLHRVRCVKE